MNTRIFTPQRVLIAVGVIVLLLLLRNCFNAGGGAGNAPDQVNIRYDAAPTNLNPFLTTQGTDIYTSARIFQSFGDLNPKTLELEPTIITKIPQARQVTSGTHAGELAYDFEFLPEAVWDNGTPITGNDVAFTLKIVFHPLLPVKSFLPYYKDFSGIDVDATNPKKFTVYFRKYYFLALESVCQTPVMPQYHYDAQNLLTQTPMADFLDTAKLSAMTKDPKMAAFYESFKQPKFANDPNGVVGSGPYRLETMNDQGTILVKKENWWGDKLADKIPNLAAYPKRLVYKVVKDENVVENMLKNEELDIVAGSFSGSRFLQMKEKDSLKTKYNFDLLPALQYNRWVFNLTDPKLKDVKVRRALAHVVDYEHFIKNIRSGLAMRTTSPVLPAKSYYAKDLPLYHLDIEKAKSLLAEAGWSDSDGDGYVDKMENGQRVKFLLEIMVTPIRTNQQYAESLTETCRLAGIELKTVVIDIAEIIAKTKAGEFQSTLIAAALFPGLTELSQRYHSSSLSPVGDNRSRYVNLKLDSLLDKISGEEDATKRNVFYLEAQKIIYDDLPEIFLFAPSQTIITASKFDVAITPNRPGYYEHWFKKK
jgi:ABC-type transport system substrate-binding protein